MLEGRVSRDFSGQVFPRPEHPWNWVWEESWDFDKWREGERFDNASIFILLKMCEYRPFLWWAVERNAGLGGGVEGMVNKSQIVEGPERQLSHFLSLGHYLVALQNQILINLWEDDVTTSKRKGTSRHGREKANIIGIAACSAQHRSGFCNSP